jgi:hypothetical protein
LLLLAPSGVPAREAVEAPRAGGEPSPRLPGSASATYQSNADRSTARTIATHTAVGAGAGLLIGLVLSGASTTDDEVTVVVTWTTLGAAAGACSGVVMWLMGRRE